MDRDEALELLRSQHAFPGPYRFRAVVRAGESAGVVTAVSAATEQVTDVEEAPSRKGTYVNNRKIIILIRASIILSSEWEPELIPDDFETIMLEGR